MSTLVHGYAKDDEYHEYHEYRWLCSTDTVKLALNARIEDFPQNYWLDDIP